MTRNHCRQVRPRGWGAATEYWTGPSPADDGDLGPGLRRGARTLRHRNGLARASSRLMTADKAAPSCSRIGQMLQDDAGSAPGIVLHREWQIVTGRVVHCDIDLTSGHFNQDGDPVVDVRLRGCLSTTSMPITVDFVDGDERRMRLNG